jgi:hypothetical protein
MFWKLSSEGVLILREEIEFRYKSITKFSEELQTYKIARQTVGRFLKGEPVRTSIAIVICEALIADLNEFRNNHVHVLPSPKIKIKQVTPNILDLLIEAYEKSDDINKQKLISLCEKIIEENV